MNKVLMALLVVQHATCAEAEDQMDLRNTKEENDSNSDDYNSEKGWEAQSQYYDFDTEDEIELYEAPQETESSIIQNNMYYLEIFEREQAINKEEKQRIKDNNDQIIKNISDTIRESRIFILTGFLSEYEMQNFVKSANFSPYLIQTLKPYYDHLKIIKQGNGIQRILQGVNTLDEETCAHNLRCLMGTQKLYLEQKFIDLYMWHVINGCYFQEIYFLLNNGFIPNNSWFFALWSHIVFFDNNMNSIAHRRSVDEYAEIFKKAFSKLLKKKTTRSENSLKKLYALFETHSNRALTTLPKLLDYVRSTRGGSYGFQQEK